MALPAYGHLDHLQDLEDTPATVPADGEGPVWDGTKFVWVETGGTRWVPLANGDPDDPGYLFTADGEGLLVEAQW